LLRGGLLAVLLCGLRLPVLNHPTPVDIDEVSFIGGLGLPAQYPVHHPGYPLWVAMGTVLHAAGLPPYAAYQVWSVLASIIGPLVLYVGLRPVLDDRLAWWLALAFGVCPLIWFQSATALSYLAGGVLGLLIVGLCYEALAARRAAAAYWAAAMLAVGVSLRADLLIYLGPMLAYVAWRFRWRQGGIVLLVIAAGVVGFVAWTSYLYGRADPTAVRPSLGHTIDVVLATSVFRLGLVDGLARNLVKIVVNLAWAFGAAALVLPVAAWLLVRHRGRWPSEVRAVLLLWIVPSTAFLATMHVVQGYFVLLAAAGYGLIGLGLQSRFAPRTAAVLAAAIALCSAVQFAAYPWSAEGGGFKRLLDAKIAFMSASGLRQIDRRADIHAPGDYWRTPAHDAQPTHPPIRGAGP
jgi:hypothetical protein